MEELVRQLESVDPWLVYTAVFSIAFIENIFPPSPSDMIIVFGGALAGMGRAGYVETLVFATAGSTLGFMTMFAVGHWFGTRLLGHKLLKFIPREAILKVEGWFRRYGYWIIVGNRFLAGTRAVVSFFAGMSELKLVRTTLLSAASALAWNLILVTSGYFLGQNWQRIGFYLSAYSQVVTALIVLFVLVWLVRFFSKRSSGKASA